MTYDVVIGLEVHAQLNTASKIFSPASTQYGAEPNTQACEIDLGLPGTLPVLNEKVIQKAVLFGVSIGAEINQENVFARKNYFYPDLPKGYQISQYSQPIVGRGHIDITLKDHSTKRIGITRAHLEEDAGKSTHSNDSNRSLVDLNRAGTPLLEIVSEPDMRSAEEAVAYLKQLHQLVQHLEICDGNMQEGSFRCDINISLKPKGQEAFGTRAEIKNVNSFRFVEKAILYEIDRQTHILNSGDKVVQETRQYDPETNQTRSMRSKEDAHDYRYFPDPDLLPVKITDDFIDQVRVSLPELPHHKIQRYVSELELTHDDASQICSDRNSALYFEALMAAVPKAKPKTIANWINGEISAALNKSQANWKTIPVDVQMIAPLFEKLSTKSISNTIAKKIFSLLWATQKDIDQIIEDEGYEQMNDSAALEKIITNIVLSNKKQVTEYQAGKTKLFGYFVGQVMKATKGQANPEQVNDLLHRALTTKNQS